MSELPVVCTLSERELAERRTGLYAGLQRHRREVRWLPDGAALRYLPEPGVMAALAELIQVESQCCRFLRLRLTVEPDGGPLWLELTGPAGTREFLEAEITTSTATQRGQGGDANA